MGNCQAVDAAAVAVIQHPDGGVESYSCPLSASDIMAANSGHYVAVIMTVTHPRSSSAAHHRSSRRSGGGDGKQVRYLKLLRPDDTLLVGHFYRLVSFEGTAPSIDGLSPLFLSISDSPSSSIYYRCAERVRLEEAREAQQVAGQEGGGAQEAARGSEPFFIRGKYLHCARVFSVTNIFRFLLSFS